MPKYRCPVCSSRNIAIGVAAFSTNVSFVCNYCNFREILSAEESHHEAIKFCSKLFVPRRYKVERRYSATGYSLFRLWAVERRKGESPGWNGLVLLPLVRERMGGIRQSLKIDGRRYAEFIVSEFCKQ